MNINEPTKYAFSLLYCTRDIDPRDVYLESTQSIVWRILWSPWRSKYPIIVFVCPFILEETRNLLRGQGAIVKEIELIDDIIPDEIISTKRWIDVLSKLNIWKEIEWQRIIFLDADAFPITNIDSLFDEVPEQTCKKELLTPEDKAVVNGPHGDDLCKYVFGGVPQYGIDNINAGLMVIKPSLAMHAKLMYAARRTQDYVLNRMEQGVLNSKNGFDLNGPFPPTHVNNIYNAFPEYYDMHLEKHLESEDGPLKVLHMKMWNKLWGIYNNYTELTAMWDRDWMDMCRFYDQDYFEETRKSGVYKSDLERFTEATEKAALPEDGGKPA